MKTVCFFELKCDDRFVHKKRIYIKLNSRIWIGPKGGPKVGVNALDEETGTFLNLPDGMAVEVGI